MVELGGISGVVEMVHTGPIRALLVEDNPGDATLTRCFLVQSLGSTVQTRCAERIGEALRCLEREAFDVVILDLVLPDAAGLEGLRRILGVVPHVPVVILSGLDDEEIAREAFEQGAQEFLVKGSAVCAEVGRAVVQAMCRKRTEIMLLQNARTSRLIVGDEVINSAQPAEILIIQPADASAATFVIDAQADCFVLHEAHTLEAARRALTRKHYDAILLDLELPDAWATDVYKTVLESNEDIPVVVLASSRTDPPSHLRDLHRPFAIVRRERVVPDLLRRLLISAALRNRALRALPEATLDAKCVPPRPPNMWRH
jgi:DNA-binding NarL/FixJ family response regulator